MVAATKRLHSRVEVIFMPRDVPRFGRIFRSKVLESGGVATTAPRFGRMRGAGFEPANPYGTGF